MHKTEKNSNSKGHGWWAYVYKTKEEEEEEKNSYCHLSKFTVYRTNKYQDPEKRKKKAHRIGVFFLVFRQKILQILKRGRRKKNHDRTSERFSS